MKEKIDLPVGTRFGKLTIVKEANPYIDSAGHKFRTFECKCDCGNIEIKRMNDLRAGKVVQCKSCRYHHESLVGNRYDRLLVVDEAEKIKGKISWNCICDCGNKCIISSERLKNGSAKSCGCLNRENVSKRLTIDGRTKKRIYRCYYAMLQRCTNPKNPRYDLWGGRGIDVCNEWKNSYIEFEKWSMSNGYQDDLTLDRIDFNKNYCPENCRWISKAEQQRNKRNNVEIEFNGEKHIIPVWSEITGFPISMIANRLRRGWTVEDALTIPKMERGERYSKL